VDMNMDMDEKFHIHGKPGLTICAMYASMATIHNKPYY